MLRAEGSTYLQLNEAGKGVHMLNQGPEAEQIQGSRHELTSCHAEILAWPVPFQSMASRACAGMPCAHDMQPMLSASS